MNPDDIERARYLAALEDERAERETLHPHRPVLEPRPARHLTTVPAAVEGVAGGVDTHTTIGRYLSDAEREHGRRRIAQMRALIEQNRTRRRTAS